MLLRIFKTSQPLSWILILLLLVLVRAVLFYSFFEESFAIESGSFAGSFTGFLGINYPVISHVLSLAIIIPSGFFYNKIAQDVNLFKGIHYLLFLFFGVFTLFNPYDLVLTPTLISLPLMLFSLAMILTQSKGTISLPNVFNASFLIGLATIISPVNFIAYFILVIGIFYLNNATWRSIFISSIGIFTPILFHDLLIYSFQWDVAYFMESFGSIFHSFSFSWLGSPYSIMTLIGILVLQLPTFIANTSRSIIKIRKSLFLILYYLIIGIIFSGFITNNHISLATILILPISVIFTAFQLELKRWWIGDFIFIGLLVSVALNYLKL